METPRLFLDQHKKCIWSKLSVADLLLCWLILFMERG